MFDKALVMGTGIKQPAARSAFNRHAAEWLRRQNCQKDLTGLVPIYACGISAYRGLQERLGHSPDTFNLDGEVLATMFARWILLSLQVEPKITVKSVNGNATSYVQCEGWLDTYERLSDRQSL